MKPYKNQSKFLRKTWSFGLAKKFFGMYVSDVKKIWSFYPPLPTSIRVFLTSLMTFVAVTPLLFALIPPLFAVLAYKILTSEECQSFYSCPYVNVLKLTEMSLKERATFGTVMKVLSRVLNFGLGQIIAVVDYYQLYRVFSRNFQIDL